MWGRIEHCDPVAGTVHKDVCVSLVAVLCLGVWWRKVVEELRVWELLPGLAEGMWCPLARLDKTPVSSRTGTTAAVETGLTEGGPKVALRVMVTRMDPS